MQLPNGRKFSYPAIVDSGADDTTFPAAVLAAYKMPWSKLTPAPIPKTMGVGGEFEQRITPASVRYDGKLFCKRILVVEKIAMPVVGRSDFFETFTVDFSGWIGTQPYMTIERR